MPLKSETGVIISMCLFYVSRSHILVAISSRFLKQRFVKTKGITVPVNTTKRYGGSGGTTSIIHSLNTRRRWVHSLTHQLLYPQGQYLGIHWIGGEWVGPKSSLDPLEKRTISCPSKIKPPFLSHPTGSLVAILTTHHGWRYLNNQ
jgi:hypothetical protein